MREGLREGELVAGRYRVEHAAGQGGMAVVHRGRDERTGAPVAIKVLLRASEIDRERFKREATTLEALEHPGIVRALAHGSIEDGTPYLVMEWLEGEDLEVRLQRGALDVPGTLALGARVAAALGEAHARGVVHRDVKPSNIVLVGGRLEEARVIDFGVARATLAAGVTSTGLVVGTPGYMSPEQARGVHTVDARADVFALGCVLFECLAGAPPFVGDHPVAILAKILMADPPRVGTLRSVPAELDELVARMLSKSPEDRPADGAAVAGELARVALGEGVAASRPSMITEHEQQVVSVVLALLPDADSDATIAQEDHVALTTRVSRAVVALGATFEVTVDGSIVVVPRADSPTDKAALAARCALALERALPGRTVVVATGRALVSRGVPMGRVIDAAVALARRVGAREAVIVDEATRALLDARFELSGDELVGERGEGGGTRTVLGRATPLVGRARELATLARLFEQTVAEGAPRCAVVTGAPGQGKTRLAEELARAVIAAEPRARVWRARADALAAGSAFGLVAQLVRASIGDDVGWSRVRDHVAALLPENPTAAEFLGELVRSPPPTPGVRLVSARADAVVMSDQITTAFVDLMLAEGGAAPLVVIVDDLQWGDLPSVKLLDALLRADGGLPLFVVALARPEVDETFPALWSERDVTRLALGALSRKASEQLVRSVLGEGADGAIVARIVAAAEGNPFSLEELLRTAGASEAADLPDSVLAMSSRRLEAFDPDTRQVLRAASVFGPRFWRDGLVALVGDAKTRAVDVALDVLARAEVIAPAPSSRLAGQREFEFRHAIVQEAAYAMLPDADRELGHRLAATWLVARGELEPVTLATHAERGGDRSAASEWWVVAGEQALEGSDLRAASERAERAVVDAAAPRTRGAARRVQAEASFWAGDQQATRRRATEALRLLEPGSVAWFEAALFAFSATSQLGDAPATLALVEEVRAARASADARVTQVQTLAVGAGYLVLQGATERAEELLDEIEPEANAVAAERPGVLARTTVSRTILAYVRADLGAYIKGTRAAAQLFLAAGDQRRELGQRANLAHALGECGAYEAAVRVGRDVEIGATRLGLPHTVALARQNLGHALTMLGAHEDAERAQRAALEEFARGSHKRLEGASHVYLALGALAREDLDAAATHASRAIEVLDASPPLLPFALAVRAEVTLRRGDAAAARADAARALERLDALGGEGEGITTILCAAAEAALACGDRAAALEAATRGVRHVEGRAVTLKDASLRESFAKVRENLRLAELARLAGGPGDLHP